MTPCPAARDSFALGIGLIPPGIPSWVESLIGSYALALFVPIYLELSRRLALTHPAARRAFAPRA